MLTKLLTLVLEKTKCEASFNELPEEDVFEDVEVFSNCLLLFDECLSAYNDIEIQVSSAKPKIRKLVSLIVEIFSFFLEGIEVSRSRNREKKLRRLLDNIYIRHSKSLRSRPQMLSLFSCLALVAHERTRDFVTSYLLKRYDTTNELLEWE